jgi:tetratricopeptide (TPR) repeat protein
MFKAARGFAFPIYVRREAVTLTLLTLLAIALFVFVSALSGMYQAQQQALADRWASRGTDDLHAGEYKVAADEFRTALRYSHDDFAQQLGLAEALIGMKRIPEAEVYLVNLWEQEPENGIVNRELARIAAGRGNTRQALRYYHNAIYATWPGDAENERRETRWELIKYLLNLNARALAQSELISLDAEVGGDPQQQLVLGQYFLKVQDDLHALACFRIVLAADPHSEEALAGAGVAAFYMEDYEQAERYLRKALAEKPGDRGSATRLETTEQVLRLDPFRGDLSDADRDRAVIAAFGVAGDRLKACSAAGGSAGPTQVTILQAATAVPQPQPTLADTWNHLKPHMTERQLQKTPDLVNQAMGLVFAIERQANGKCGAGTPSDAAVLLISKLHEGS